MTVYKQGSNGLQLKLTWSSKSHTRQNFVKQQWLCKKWQSTQQIFIPHQIILMMVHVCMCQHYFWLVQLPHWSSCWGNPETDHLCRMQRVLGNSSSYILSPYLSFFEGPSCGLPHPKKISNRTTMAVTWEKLSWTFEELRWKGLIEDRGQKFIIAFNYL